MTSNLVSVSLWPQLTWESPLRDEAEDWKVGSVKLFYLSSISAKLTPTVFIQALWMPEAARDV